MGRELEEMDERLRCEITAGFRALAAALPVLRVYSCDWADDGQTFVVSVDVAGGIMRSYYFTPGKPVRIMDHGGMHLD